MMPSRNPANNDWLRGLLETFGRKAGDAIDVQLPARVTAFNGDRNHPIVTVQILYTVTDSDGGRHPMGQVQVPVKQLSGGGYGLFFPISVGDFGWIESNDHDISLFLKNYQNAPGNTKRIHSFEDGLFYPDVMRGYTVPPTETGVTLQSLDGTRYFSIDETSVKMVCGAASFTLTENGLEITAPTLTHNGTNIGDTHIHSQDADSDGDSEVDTGYPHS